MAVGGLFSRLVGIRPFLRRRGILSLARRAFGRQLRRPVTAELRMEFPELSFMEAQTLTRLGFESRLAGRRLQRILTRRPLALRDVPIVPVVTDDALFGDRFQSTITYEWFDETTGLSGFDTAQIGTLELPGLESLKEELEELVEEGDVSSTALQRMEDRSKVIIQISAVEAITRGF